MLWFLILLVFGSIFYISVYGNTKERDEQKDIKDYERITNHKYK